MQSLKDQIIVLLSGPLVWPVVHTLCKWNPEICGHLCLTAFAKHPISRFTCVAAVCASICKCVCYVSASVGVGCNACCSRRVARRGHRIYSLLTSLRPDLSLNLELKLYWLDWELASYKILLFLLPSVLQATGMHRLPDLLCDC